MRIRSMVDSCSPSTGVHVQHFETRQKKSHAQTLPRTPLNRGATPAVKHVKLPILISASRDLSNFLKLIFKRQTMLELFFSSA